MDPPKPKSPASIAHEPGGTPPTHLTGVGDIEATRSSSTFVPPILSVSSDDASFGAVPGGQRRASLTDDRVRSSSQFDASVEAAHTQAAPSQTVMTATSDVPSSAVPGGQRRGRLADDANMLVHNQAVASNSSVGSESTPDVGGSLPASIADNVVRPFLVIGSGVGLEHNQAVLSESTPGAARRSPIVNSSRGLPRRASVQVVDDVCASSSLADSLVGPLSVQAMPSIESSISLRSAVDLVRQRRAAAATDASLLSSPLDSVADTSHNQAVPSGTWPTEDLGSSTHSAGAHHVLVTNDAIGKSGHVAQIEQSDDVSAEHLKGSSPLLSVSRRASHEALVTIGQPVSTIAEAVASLDSLHTNRPPQFPSSDHLSKNDHNASHSSISPEPAVLDHSSVVAATSPSDASLRHDVGAAASRLTEAAALLTEAAALLSKASGTSSWSPHEQPHGLGAPNAFASAPSTDVRDAAHAGDHLTGVSQGPLDVHNSLQAQGTPEVMPDPALVAALATAVGQPTGWAAVEKVMTESYLKNTEGYKEDIDSLLTFIGLYSAVLTAFVVVSYPLLQEDTAGESLQALQVIANQTSLTKPTVHAFTSSSPFQPSSAAIRINILWFASLVISLATASFALLVKQWLRSYLKFASSSPQGQLRIRHFRLAGLHGWKVFDIASALPLLLQVSLALFFAGLCIFTLDVHPTIGHITIPLVGAWLFLFMVVTLSPSFSARCPYTTPALARITHILRCHIYPPFVTVFMKYICFGVFMGVAYMLLPVLLALSWLEDKYSTSKIMEHVGDSIETVWEYLKSYESSKPAEEAGMINNTQYDLEILASADALQADDRLLGTTIKSALEQSDATWVQLVEFAVQIIANRIPVVDSETNLEHILNAYRSLSPSVRSVIEEIFLSHAASKATEMTDDSVIFPKDWQTIACWAVCIIFQVNLEEGPENLLPTAEKQRWQTKVLDLAFRLYHMATIKLDDAEVVEEDRSLQLADLQLLSFHKGNVNMEKQLVTQCLSLSFPTICQMLAAAYHIDSDICQLSNVIHSIVDYDSSDFKHLKAIEILKLSLLSVRVMYGKIHHNRDSRPKWSSVEAAQWKRTFIWLAHRLWDFWPFSNLSPDELAALHQLARSGWKEIPDPTEDSTQEALPLPDYFCLILWRAAGEDLSQIPSQHPQLLRVAHMSGNEQYAIWDKGWDMAQAYRQSPGNLYPPGTEDDNGQGQEGRATSAPVQDTQHPISNDPRVDAEEVGVYGGLQRELPTDTSDMPLYDSEALSEAEVRTTEAAEQYSWTVSGPAGSIQPGQTPSPMPEIIHNSEDIDHSPGERLNDKDCTKKLQPAKGSMEPAEGPDDIPGMAVHQASAEGEATPSISESRTMPMTLPTSAHDETVPAEARDEPEVATNNTRAGSTALPDNTTGKDNSLRADNITAGSFHIIQGSSSERDEGTLTQT